LLADKHQTYDVLLGDKILFGAGQEAALQLTSGDHLRFAALREQLAHVRVGDTQERQDVIGRYLRPSRLTLVLT
jgi:hypothetical protein